MVSWVFLVLNVAIENKYFVRNVWLRILYNSRKFRSDSGLPESSARDSSMRSRDIARVVALVDNARDFDRVVISYQMAKFSRYMADSI